MPGVRQPVWHPARFILLVAGLKSYPQRAYLAFFDPWGYDSGPPVSKNREKRGQKKLLVAVPQCPCQPHHIAVVALKLETGGQALHADAVFP